MQNGADASALASRRPAPRPGGVRRGERLTSMLNTLNNANDYKDSAGRLRQHRSTPTGSAARRHNADRGAHGSPVRWPTARNYPASWPNQRSLRRGAHPDEGCQRHVDSPDLAGQTIAGGSTGDTVHACARAAWVRRAPTASPSSRSSFLLRMAANTLHRKRYYAMYPPAAARQHHGPTATAPQSAPPNSWSSTPGQEIIITLQGGPHAPRVRTGTATTWPAASATIDASGCSQPVGGTAGSRSTPATARPVTGRRSGAGHLPPRLRLRHGSPTTIPATTHRTSRRPQLRHRKQHLLPHRGLGEVLPQWLQGRRISRNRTASIRAARALQWRRPVHLGLVPRGRLARRQ